MTPKNSYTKLVRLVRRGNLHEANIVFADIMQQKSVDRLNEERKSLVTESEDEIERWKKAGGKINKVKNEYRLQRPDGGAIYVPSMEEAKIAIAEILAVLAGK